MIEMDAPWKVGDRLGSYVSVDSHAPGEEGLLVALACYPGVARLIAAAPEMLEALELAVETLDDDAPGPGTTEKDLLRQIRTTIAKARGE